MLVSARSARSGTQLYTGAEVGKPELPWVTVYRDATDVFDKESLESYTAIPVTINHPKSMVTADNWKEVSVGETDGAIKDGDFIRVPFTVRHKKAIKSITDGHAEISMGYTCDLLWDAGTTATGEAYDAKVVNLRMNHLAVVGRARGGDKLRIGDDADNLPNKETKSMKKLVFDGISVSIEDHDAVESGFAKLNDKIAALETTASTALSDKATAEAAVAKATTDNVAAIEVKDAEVATLTATVATLTAELADARDPAKLRDAAAEYALVVSKGKALGATVADADTAATVKRNAVNVKLGDVAANWTDAQIDVSFATLTASVTVADTTPDAFRDAMAHRNVTDFADAAAKAKTAREKMIAGLSAPRETVK